MASLEGLRKRLNSIGINFDENLDVSGVSSHHTSNNCDLCVASYTIPSEKDDHIEKQRFQIFDSIIQ